MGLAVELYFDGAAEARVLAAWDAATAAAGVDTMRSAGARPHVSLTVLKDDKREALFRAVESFAADAGPVRTTLSAVGMFPGEEGVVYLAPSVSAELTELHGAFHDRLRGHGFADHEYYRPGRWVPHCTVAIGLRGEAWLRAAEACRGSDAFGPVTLREIGVVSFPPVSTLCLHALGGVPRGMD